MKIKFLLATLAFGGILFLSACNNSTPKKEQKQTVTQPAKVEYTCEMHPEVISDKPGKCPKCGMDLIKK